MNRILFAVLVSGAVPCAAIAAPRSLSDREMETIAAGATTLDTTINQVANAVSTATCTNCTATGSSGVGVTSSSQAINVANINEVLTGSAKHPVAGNLTGTINQTANGTSAASCTNCTASAPASGTSGIGVTSNADAINIANVHEIVTGGAIRKDGAITLNTTIDQTANSTSSATCTNCSASSIGVNSASDAINIANLRQIVAGGPQAGSSVTMNTTINQTANSTSGATCATCAGSSIGVSSTSQSINLGNVRQVVH